MNKFFSPRIIIFYIIRKWRRFFIDVRDEFQIIYLNVSFRKGKHYDLDLKGILKLNFR